MIRINLLPFRAARKTENIRRQLAIFFGILVVVIAAMVFAQIKLNGKIDDLNTKIEEINSDIRRVQITAKKVDKIKAALAVLNKKMDVIENLKMSRYESVRFLDIITDVVVPKRMWLSDLSTKGKKINIRGIALDNKTVADFMTKLEEASRTDGGKTSKWFSGINLATLTQKKVRRNILKSFQLKYDPHDFCFFPESEAIFLNILDLGYAKCKILKNIKTLIRGGT